MVMPAGEAEVSDSGSDIKKQRIKQLIKHELNWEPPEREPATNGEGSPPASQGVKPSSRRAGLEHSLCGLALSGGGIRSATFNLGVLQGLQQLGLLDIFHYLATVSGGGYIGGFWTAWQHHKGQPGVLFPSSGKQGARGADLAEVRHLREFSNFLSPRLGLLSADTGRLLAAVLGALIPSLLATLSFLVLVLLAWAVLASAVFSGEPLHARLPEGLTTSLVTMFLGTLAMLGFFEVSMRREEERAKAFHSTPEKKEPEKKEPGEKEPAGVPANPPAGQERKRSAYYAGAALFATGTVLVLWWYLLAPTSSTELALWRPWRPYLFAPCLAWAGATGVLVLLRWLSSRLVTEKHQVAQAAVDRLISRLLFLAVFWAVSAAVWLAGALLGEYLDASFSGLKATSFVGLVAALTVLFARAQQLFGRQTNKPASASLMERLKPLIPQLLAYATLALLVLGLIVLILRAERGGWLSSLVAAAGGITLLTLFFFDANNVGLHAFYRSRIARAYLGAAHGLAPGQTEPHPQDDIRLDQLHNAEGPIPLFCCAANDLSSEDPMANLYRGADSAVLSPVGFSVGYEWATWKKSTDAVSQVPTLSAAMTASSAALNSHMGGMSMKLGPAVTFLMTAFNLRLGLWWPHPVRARRKWYERLCGGLPFYKEMLGLSRATGRDVLLSDGGHFENLALYELIRRNCRYIVLSDCGMDSETAFNDFANAVRRVREDFGVEIRIDLSPLRPGPDGLARQPMVAGDIEYSDGDIGVLLLFKPTLVGNEPADITQYKARNRAFPHETTGDQFYDEPQWESYRRLGEHAALSAFRPVLRPEQTQRLEKLARLFADARHEWLPIPAGYKERFSRLAQRASELDQLLQHANNRKMFREVFKEITELDAQAKSQLGMRRFVPFGLNGMTGNGPALKKSSLSSRDLAVSLQMIRRAVLFMEEVFISEDLETHYNHPTYLGIINYFARWAYSPLFRMWWPLLKTLYPQRFTRFLEHHFSLPGMEHKDIGKLSRKQEGFAWSCWERQGGRPPIPKQERLVSYQLDMPYAPVSDFHIQAAQVLVRVTDEHEKPLEYDDAAYPGRRLLMWNASEFYVPPGLWGSGVGEDFLRLLTANCTTSLDGCEDVSLLAVKIITERDAAADVRKAGADLMQLYRARGFTEPSPGLRSRLTELNPDTSADGARSERTLHRQSHWLVRKAGPPEVDSTRREQSPGAQRSQQEGFPSEGEPAH